MQEIILSIMGKYGYIGVFLLIMIENVFPPIPSEVILLFGGFMTTYNADNWFDNKGNKTVFFCRFIPLVRSLISIPAGMSEMSMFKFLLYTLFGSLIWNTVLIIVGNVVGENWTKIVNILDTYSHIVVLILFVVVVVGVYFFYRKRSNKKS